MITDPTAQGAPTPAPVAVPEGGRPPVVCLCGSTRFYDQFQQAYYDLTMAGEIVLSVGFYPHVKAEHGHGEGVGHDSAEKVALDELHKRKIDLADYVYVLNVGGYIGDSTRSEIDYAIRNGVPVSYMEPPREDARRPESVTAPLPSAAVRVLAAALYRLEWNADLYATPRGAYTEKYERRAQRLSAALPHLLPAADQRARDEGAVRRAVLDAIEDEGPDTENPASRERIRGWRECAQDVRDALESVEDEGAGRETEPIDEHVDRLLSSAGFDETDRGYALDALAPLLRRVR